MTLRARLGADTPAGNAASADRRTVVLSAVALVSVIVGLAIALEIFPNVWAVDAERNLSAASDLLAGRFGSDHGYVYSPLAAALTVPWTWLPASLSIGLWLALRAAILLVGVAVATHAWSLPDRILTAVSVVMFVPVLYDLLLGNVSILLAAAVALVAWRRDDWRSGIVLGLVLATIPKPQLAPVLVWMLVYRPRALSGAVGVAATATAIGLLILGLGPYEAWIAVLRSVDYAATPMHGNLSLFAFAPGPLGWVLATIAVFASVVGLIRGPLPGLVAAIVLGILVAPYTLAYAPVLLLVVARKLADDHPRGTIALAVTGSLAVIVALPVWLAGVAAAALLPRRGAGPNAESNP